MKHPKRASTSLFLHTEFISRIISFNSVILASKGHKHCLYKETKLEETVERIFIESMNTTFSRQWTLTAQGRDP